MKRRLFNLFVAASLLLCTTTAVLWVRSYWFYDGWATMSEQQQYSRLASGNGAIEFSLASPPGDKPSPPRWRWSFLGFSYAHDDVILNESYHLRETSANHVLNNGFGFPGQLITVPYWAVTTIFLTPAAIMARRLFRQRRRNKTGMCPICGYDLRATPERCPECWTIPRRRDQIGRT